MKVSIGSVINPTLPTLSTVRKFEHGALVSHLSSCLLPFTGILLNMSEITKAEMGVVAVMLGLLPGVLQMIGPKVSDLSVLATRRPLLALFLTIGSPCPAFDYTSTGMESLLKESPPFWPAFLKKRRLWLKTIVSLIEYLIVMLAAGNVVYQFYRITFYAVVLISTQLGQYGGTTEAFAPLLWVFLGVPIHALGALQIRWCSVPSDMPRKRTGLVAAIHDELTPCVFATDIRPNSVQLENGFLFQFLDWVLKLVIWADVVYGIIVLSTVVFVPMWSAIWMIGLIFTGTLLCRCVLAFEMHGFRIVPEVRVPRKSSEAYRETDGLMEKQALAPEHTMHIAYA